MSQLWANLGTGGTALDARNGLGTGVDSNDAKLLEHDGTNYLYTGGSLGRAWLPDANYAGSGDFSIRIRAAANWQTTTFGALCGNTNQTSTGFRFFTGNTVARLAIAWYDSGTSSFRSITANADNPAGMATDARIWVRVDFDRDNGASQCAASFYWAADSASEPTVWTQIGTTATAATVANLAYTGDGRGLGIGSQTGDGNTNGLIGSYYRLVIYTDLTTTTKSADVDTSVITSGAATSFTATTGQTVTINRSTSGRKSVAVVRPVWLLGTANYLEIADNALLDFGASDSFTVMAVVRSWATQGFSDAIIAKKASGALATTGWIIQNDGGAATELNFRVSDGAAMPIGFTGARAMGSLVVISGVRNTTSDNLTMYLGSTAGTAVTDTTTLSVANSEAVRIGRLSGAGTEYSDMELMAVAVFRRALAAGEISALSTYYATRFP